MIRKEGQINKNNALCVNVSEKIIPDFYMPCGSYPEEVLIDSTRTFAVP
jgi:hypothetical protein